MPALAYVVVTDVFVLAAICVDEAFASIRLATAAVGTGAAAAIDVDLASRSARRAAMSEHARTVAALIVRKTRARVRLATAAIRARQEIAALRVVGARLPREATTESVLTLLGIATTVTSQNARFSICHTTAKILTDIITAMLVQNAFGSQVSAASLVAAVVLLAAVPARFAAAAALAGVLLIAAQANCVARTATVGASRAARLAAATVGTTDLASVPTLRRRLLVRGNTRAVFLRTAAVRTFLGAGLLLFLLAQGRGDAERRAQGRQRSAQHGPP
jgi:hypothetical protein